MPKYPYSSDNQRANKLKPFEKMLHSVAEGSPRDQISDSIESQRLKPGEYYSPYGERLYKMRFPATTPQNTTGISAAKAGSGVPRVNSTNPKDLEKRMGYYTVANHETEHAVNQSPDDRVREIPSVIGDVVFATEQFRKENGKSLQHNVALPGVTHDANWMAEMAKKHGYWDGRPMSDLLYNTTAGQQWLDRASSERPDTDLPMSLRPAESNLPRVDFRSVLKSPPDSPVAATAGQPQMALASTDLQAPEIQTQQAPTRTASQPLTASAEQVLAAASNGAGQLLPSDSRVNRSPGAGQIATPNSPEATATLSPAQLTRTQNTEVEMADINKKKPSLADFYRRSPARMPSDVIAQSPIVPAGRPARTSSPSPETPGLSSALDAAFGKPGSPIPAPQATPQPQAGYGKQLPDNPLSNIRSDVFRGYRTAPYTGPVPTAPDTLPKDIQAARDLSEKWKQDTFNELYRRTPSMPSEADVQAARDRRLAADGPSADQRIEATQAEADQMQKRREESEARIQDPSRVPYGARNAMGPLSGEGELDRQKAIEQPSWLMTQDEALAEGRSDVDAMNQAKAANNAAMSSREDNAIKDPSQMRRDMNNLTTEYYIYKRKGGDMKFRDWAKAMDERSTMSGDLRNQLEHNYPGIFDGKKVDPAANDIDATAASKRNPTSDKLERRREALGKLQGSRSAMIAEAVARGASPAAAAASLYGGQGSGEKPTPSMEDSMRAMEMLGQFDDGMVYRDVYRAAIASGRSVQNAHSEATTAADAAKRRAAYLTQNNPALGEAIGGSTRPDWSKGEPGQVAGTNTNPNNEKFADRDEILTTYRSLKRQGIDPTKENIQAALAKDGKLLPSESQIKKNGWSNVITDAEDWWTGGDAIMWKHPEEEVSDRIAVHEILFGSKPEDKRKQKSGGTDPYASSPSGTNGFVR